MQNTPYENVLSDEESDFELGNPLMHLFNENYVATPPSTPPSELVKLKNLSLDSEESRPSTPLCTPYDGEVTQIMKAYQKMTTPPIPKIDKRKYDNNKKLRLRSNISTTPNSIDQRLRAIEKRERLSRSMFYELDSQREGFFRRKEEYKHHLYSISSDLSEFSEAMQYHLTQMDILSRSEDRHFGQRRTFNNDEKEEEEEEPSTEDEGEKKKEK